MAALQNYVWNVNNCRVVDHSSYRSCSVRDKLAKNDHRLHSKIDTHSKLRLTLKYRVVARKHNANKNRTDMIATVMPAISILRTSTFESEPNSSYDEDNKFCMLKRIVCETRFKNINWRSSYMLQRCNNNHVIFLALPWLNISRLHRFAEAGNTIKGSFL